MDRICDKCKKQRASILIREDLTATIHEKYYCSKCFVEVIDKWFEKNAQSLLKLGIIYPEED